MYLNSLGIRSYIGTAFVNHLCYTDQLCFISLSSSGMQQLLRICNMYARNINCYIMDRSNFPYASREELEVN